MASWGEFVAQAPRVSEIFLRRHAATGGLCMLGTLRSDGYPRISPIEPRITDAHMWISGMPNTFKLRDLSRDPRFTLHTATVDTHVSGGCWRPPGYHDLEARRARTGRAQALTVAAPLDKGMHDPLLGPRNMHTDANGYTQ
jgi:Pyridoxamine 5'-phosphate oxidase